MKPGSALRKSAPLKEARIQPSPTPEAKRRQAAIELEEMAPMSEPPAPMVAEMSGLDASMGGAKGNAIASSSSALTSKKAAPSQPQPRSYADALRQYRATPSSPKADSAQPEGRLRTKQKQSAPTSATRALPGKSAKRAAPFNGARPTAQSFLASPGNSLMAQPLMAIAGDQAVAPPPTLERDRHEEYKTNPVKRVSEAPVSTFSVDVDTASYSFVRRLINRGRLPAPNAVRVEEMINYFDYDYAVPTDLEKPFQPNVSLFPTPWNPNTRLMQIGIKGYALADGQKPRSNLVFLLDVSGSMSSRDKLPLLKQSLRLLINTLEPQDTIAIAVYAGAAGSVLEPTPVKERHKILAALDQLQAGGSTAGGAGIELAYSLAEGNFQKDAVNRVILATDGDFNVGVANHEALKGLIARKRKSGIFLSVLGFGQGNYNDQLMQTLAQNGNGIAAYIDTLSEARKVLVEEASANLFPIARDVKIQVEFNPQRVAEYRLIGYETRHLNRADFNNDQVDAGDVGSGHSVTALYEITPVGSVGLMDELRYGRNSQAKAQAKSVTNGASGTEPVTGEMAFLKMRYKLPGEAQSRLMSQAITDADLSTSVDNAPRESRFATAVAAFAQLLRGGTHLQGFEYDEIIALAQSAKGDDPFGYRAEFISMVRLAASLER
ncbi:MAG: von Willebrand factor type A domain-containing protein [Magnetococcales bacterium]|nr:von Willebrand factor type A domain-containing protein [Magnetococcales bacterium]